MACLLLVTWHVAQCCPRRGLLGAWMLYGGEGVQAFARLRKLPLLLPCHPPALDQNPVPTHIIERQQHRAPSFIAAPGIQRTPPLSRRARSSHSDHTMSSSDGSPIRKPRPHSIAGRFPSYASHTVSSQARLGRSEEKKDTGNTGFA